MYGKQFILKTGKRLMCWERASEIQKQRLICWERVFEIHSIKKKANVFMKFTAVHVSPDYNRTYMTVCWKSCILTDRAKALEDPA